jgi:hypothetical protein
MRCEGSTERRRRETEFCQIRFAGKGGDANWEWRIGALASEPRFDLLFSPSPNDDEVDFGFLFSVIHPSPSPELIHLPGTY